MFLYVFGNKFRFLKGVFAKNERGYKLTAKNKRFWIELNWSLLLSLLSVAFIRRKLLTTTHAKERSVHTNWESCNILLRSKIINLIPNKSFRYYEQQSSIFFRRIHIKCIFHNIYDYVFVKIIFRWRGIFEHFLHLSFSRTLPLKNKKFISFDFYTIVLILFQPLKLHFFF